MTKELDSIQHAGNLQLKGVTTKFSSFGTILEEIFTEGTDYTKKLMDTRLVFVEKLLGAKSLDTVIQVQSEYAKTLYADFAAQATKMGELYSNLAKACFKPIELTMSTCKARSNRLHSTRALNMRARASRSNGLM